VLGVRIAARIAAVAALLVAVGLAAVPFLELVGLGVHRHARPFTIAFAAIGLVAGPAVVAAAVASKTAWRPFVFPAVLALWALVLQAALPVYFPGERREAVSTGLAMLGLGSNLFGLSERIVASLPDEPTLATPELSEATPVTVDVVPAGEALADDQIALPYEGQGRSLSVPVSWGHGDRELEIDMMLDTGATYSTLSTAGLARLGIFPSDADPVIELHTANGERKAQVVLVDRVWLGDLEVHGVAVATCDDCAMTDSTGGLLGLNVTGGFNLSIDGDRREVVFTRRPNFDRQLDVKPFIDLSARFTLVPGGRVEVDVHLANDAPRAIQEAVAAVRCEDKQWTVPFPSIQGGVEMDVNRRLPAHTPCDQYEISLHRAVW
jgi:clan AA aspartic protease (TIGR02281 family)